MIGIVPLIEVSTDAPSFAWTCVTVAGVPAAYGPADRVSDSVGHRRRRRRVTEPDCQAPSSAAIE